MTAHFVTPRRFRHGQPVTLTDAHGNDFQGTLHLPPVPMQGQHGEYLQERVALAGYGLHTIVRDGSFFRTEGRLS